METKIKKNIIQTAQNVLLEESKAIKSLINTIDETFPEIVNEILNSNGKIVLSGIGKSGLIAQKIAATLNSTGQKAVFMHASDAVHGDLGIIDDKDIIIILSKSGNTPELKVLIPLIKRLPNKLVAMVSSIDSFLAKSADYIINAHVEKEACPMNLAPTTSTTVALALGDALAVSLLESRGFTKRDFAKFHPGGSLGKKLYLKVADIYPNNEVPLVNEDAGLETVIMEISSKRLGATAVVNDSDQLIGIITDGDLRRKLREKQNILEMKAKNLMTPAPKTISKNEFAVNALNRMQDMSISQLIVEESGKVLGFIHLHDLLKEGLV